MPDGVRPELLTPGIGVERGNGSVAPENKLSLLTVREPSGIGVKTV